MRRAFVRNLNDTILFNNPRAQGLHNPLESVSNGTKRELFHGYEEAADNDFFEQVNIAVLAHLEEILGKGVLASVNYHLKILVNVDISELVSQPSTVEKGLRKLFGVGAKVIIQQCMLAAYRSNGLVPDRDFNSLEEAIGEMRKRTILQHEEGELLEGF